MGRGNIFRKFYVKVSKIHYYRVITEQFWASLEGVEKVTFITEKELSRILIKIEEAPTGHGSDSD